MLPGLGEQVEYARTGDDLPLLMAQLREEHGVRSVLCEGGPTLNSYLLAAGPGGRALPDAQPQARRRRGGADDRGRAASWWRRPSSS